MPLLKLSLWVALLGFVTSLTIHVCALLGLDLFPSTLMTILGVGLLLTIVPASRLAGLDDKSVPITEHCKRIRKVMTACPLAMRYGTILLFLYGITTIIASMDISFGTSQEMPNAISRIRSLSAVLVAFYAVAGTLSYSIIHKCERAGRNDPKTRSGSGLRGTDEQ